MSYFDVFNGILGSLRSKPAAINGTGQIGVEVGGSNASAFGDLLMVEHTPVIQQDWVVQPITASVMTQLGGAYTANGGTAGTSNGRLALTTSASTTGRSIWISNKIARYRAGQGYTERLTPIFTTPAADSIQEAGVCVPTITWTGAPTAPGQPITDIAEVSDCYAFGYNGTTFGIHHKNARVPSDTWVAQAAWNVDVCDGTSSASNPSGFNLNPLTGNVYQIRYPYLGVGDIFFYVEDANRGVMILVHVIRYSNSSTAMQLSNPSMNLFARVIKTAGANNITMYMGSISMLLSGKREYLGPQGAWDNRVTGLGSGTEVPILTLRNCTSINGVPNRGMIRIRSLSFSTDGANAEGRLRVRQNVATLTGSTFANAYNGTITASSAGYILTAAQSIVTIDTAATAVSTPPAGASDVRFNAASARNTGYQVDMTPYDLFIVPGDSLTFCVTNFGAGGAAQVAVNWNEDT